VGDNQAVGSLCTVMTRGHEADIAFVEKELRKGSPELAAHVATLLRDKVLHKAVAKSLGVASTTLGRMLPSKCHRLRGLPPQVKQEFLDKHTAEKLYWPATEDSIERKLTPVEQDNLMEYALNSSSWNFLPHGHTSQQVHRANAAHPWDSCQGNARSLGRYHQ